jgi:pyroglutamyl-peptidase
MTKRFLLTSFDTWLDEQSSNASDDLLAELLRRCLLGDNVLLLRRLLVDTTIATQQVIAAIDRWQPDVVMCCGMASDRPQLSLESTGKDKECNCVYTTSLDLEQLCRELTMTTISDDAGSFVCNDLYCAVLKYLSDRCAATQCLFLHVPPLTPDNTEHLIADCTIILQRLGHCTE